MLKPFRFFFHFALVYHAVAALLVVSLRDDWKQSLQYVYIKTNAAGSIFSVLSIAGLAATFAILILAYRMEDRIPQLSFVFAAFGTLLFMPSFLMIKSVLPLLVPYFADPLLAAVDQKLHLGKDPWKFTHYDLPHFPIVLGSALYGQIWYAFSLLAPTAVAILDRNRNRQTRFILAYLASWIILGNLLAIALMSGGPVFFDRLTDTTRFQEFNIAFAASGLLQSYVAETQRLLWLLYTEYSQSFGSGISAFPSLHVAMAMLYTLYLWDISRILAGLASLFLLFILYFSVFTGFHYAIDGYASIVLLFIGWRWLRKIYP